MKPVILFAALLFALILIQSVSRTSDAPDPNVAARLAQLEARTELLTQRLARIEQAAQAVPLTGQPAAATPFTTVGSKDSAVDWRLGVGLQGEPLRVAAQTFDQRRGRVELLLEIKSPLADAAAWPQQPGLEVPVILVARDSSGEVAAEQPMTLMRGPSQEPGAYLHLGTEFSEQIADRARVLELRLGVIERR
ncbi:hypothetical protein [Halochromatium roseum]|uniref:hypothetical protein n=1 Tax=Halochromatium roseum TaxID=391920 RepID=UPI001911D755|nr:hypothetical protein [Halochromatium roseum]MBK5940970.1 hypothetical protein [Halochromatium roseum]